jgi:hypothetical protein
MQADTKKELKALKTMLLTMLFDSTLTHAEFISTRSRYYKISAELYYVRKKEKLAKMQSAGFQITPVIANKEGFRMLPA